MNDDKEQTEPTENGDASGFPVDPLVIFESVDFIIQYQSTQNDLWFDDPAFYKLKTINEAIAKVEMIDAKIKENVRYRIVQDITKVHRSLVHV